MAVLKVGLGQATTALEAVAGAMKNTPQPQLVIVFCGYGFNAEQVYAEVRKAVGEKASIVGGSTSGEFSSVMATPQNGSVVIMTLQSSYLSVGIGVGENLSDDPAGCARAAVGGAHRTLQTNPTVMSLMLLALDSKKTADASRLKPFV
ncbi:MAG: FIST N-terminal domain-containing protein, partial [Leptothrix sp. (in: b-proteobacteria)]